MADKNFFELLKAKMAALKPREEQRQADWAALGARLDTAMPQQFPARRRSIVLPLLLLTMLLSTNATWWYSSQKNRSSMECLEAKLTAVQASLAANSSTKAAIQHDTIWKTVFVQTQAIHQNQAGNIAERVDIALKNRQANTTVAPDTTQNKTPGIPLPNKAAAKAASTTPTVSEIALNTATNALRPMAALLPLAHRSDHPFDIPSRETPLLTGVPTLTQEAEKPATPFTKKVSNLLRPKYFIVGANAGWLNATSKELMHEGGIVYNIRSEIGLTRHWGIMADFGIGKLHYKAHSPEAVLGAPEFPKIPNPDHHYVEIDVTGQRIRQYSLGFRYTFSQLEKLRPFIGLNWGGQWLEPFIIQYEIQHEPNGIIEKAAFQVVNKIHLKNIIGLNAGFEIPVSTRLNLMMQGYYQRQWKKPNSIAPDFTGIRTGINLVF